MSEERDGWFPVLVVVVLLTLALGTIVGLNIVMPLPPPPALEIRDTNASYTTTYTTSWYPATVPLLTESTCDDLIDGTAGVNSVHNVTSSGYAALRDCAFRQRARLREYVKRDRLDAAFHRHLRGERRVPVTTNEREDSR